MNNLTENDELLFVPPYTVHRLQANSNQSSKTMRYSFSRSHTNTHSLTHTRLSISSAGCQVFKLAMRSISTEGCSSCHSMGSNPQKVYLCVFACVCFQLAPLLTLAATPLLASAGANLSLGFGIKFHYPVGECFYSVSVCV